MSEIWKPVPYPTFGEKYLVSNLGRVKPAQVSRYSKNGAEVLKPTQHHKGYLCVTLYAYGKSKWCFVHNIVADAFLPPKPFPKAIACHKDDVKTNNAADNLYWGTNKSNFDDAVRNNGHDNKGVKNGRAKITEELVRSIREEYAKGGISQRLLGKKHGLEQTSVSSIIRGKNWPHVKSQ